jgi:hypothetical protein
MASMSPQLLTETERRVLGHLPAWRDDEGKALMAAEMQRKQEERAAELRARVESDEHSETEVLDGLHYQPYPTSYSVEELAERLAPDPSARAHDLLYSDPQAGVDLRPGEEETLHAILESLRDRGLVGGTGDRYHMLKAGLEALTA